MDKFKLLCLLEAIKGFANDIHYTAKGALFYQNHLFADRLADFYDKDEFIETFFLGELENAPLSRDIAKEVAEITPEPHMEIQENFGVLQRLIVKALLSIENYQNPTRGENAVLDGIAQKLQVYSGLLNRQVIRTAEDGFITINAGTSEERIIWVEFVAGSKKSRARISKILEDFDGKTKYDFEHTRVKISDEQQAEIQRTYDDLQKEYDFKPVAQFEVASDAQSGTLGVCCSDKNASVISLAPKLYKPDTQKQWDEAVKSGFHPKGTGDMVKSVLTHELGHAITVNSNNSEFWNKIENIRSDYMKNIKKEDIDNPDFISNYARTNREEFVAEAFSQGKLAKTYGKYTKQVMDEIDKHFKKGYQHKMFDAMDGENNDLWIENFGGGYPIDEKEYEAMRDE